LQNLSLFSFVCFVVKAHSFLKWSGSYVR